MLKVRVSMASKYQSRDFISKTSKTWGSLLWFEWTWTNEERMRFWNLGYSVLVYNRDFFRLFCQCVRFELQLWSFYFSDRCWDYQYSITLFTQYHLVPNITSVWTMLQMCLLVFSFTFGLWHLPWLVLISILVNTLSLQGTLQFTVLHQTHIILPSFHFISSLSSQCSSTFSIHQ